MSKAELPPELWETIFNELPGHQLLNVVLVSKKFKVIVEQSTMLMRKLNLVLKNSNVDDAILLQTKRKYQNLIFDEISVDSILIDFLLKQSANIESIKITNCLKKSSTSKLLKNFQVLPLKSDAKTTVEKINLKKLKKLFIMTCTDNTCIESLEILDAIRLQEFLYMSDCDVNEADLTLLKSFLLSLMKLTNLCLLGDGADKLMNSEIFVKSISFKLETFYVEFKQGSDSRSFMQFLQRHKESLKVLSVGKMEINESLLQLFRDFCCLNTFRVSNCQFRNNFNCPTNEGVRNLFLSEIDTTNSVTENGICNLLRSMHHAVKLNLTSIDVTFNLALIIAYEMKNLTSLTLIKCDFKPFSFANIKRMKFVNCEQQKVLQTLLVNRHVEYLEVEEPLQHDSELNEVINKLRIHVKYC